MYQFIFWYTSLIGKYPDQIHHTENTLASEYC